MPTNYLVVVLPKDDDANSEFEPRRLQPDFDAAWTGLVAAFNKRDCPAPRRPRIAGAYHAETPHHYVQIWTVTLPAPIH